jgi:hypothetical protein
MAARDILWKRQLVIGEAIVERLVAPRQRR